MFGVIEFLSVPSVTFQACEKNTKGDLDGEPCFEEKKILTDSKTIDIGKCEAFLIQGYMVSLDPFTALFLFQSMLLHFVE